jgi:predicted negative regulator of RcsB-dependent stress response
LPIADCRLPTARYYDTNMKKIIFLLLLAAVGVVAYKYFTEEGY